MKSTINLFKVAPKNSNINPTVDIATLLEKGIIFVDGNRVVTAVNYNLAEAAIDAYGVLENANRTFMTFSQVATYSDVQRMMFQVMHYISTYGLNLENPFIPREEITEDTSFPEKFVVISLVSDEKITKLIDKALTIAAPSKTMFEDMLETAVSFASVEPEKIRSNELRIAYYCRKDITPKNPEEVLRAAIYLTTESALVIKNRTTINKIRSNCDDPKITKLFKEANEKALATIFFRYKPLFLAFRENREVRPVINRVRRLADIYHRPLSVFRVSNFNNLVKQSRFEECKMIISSASNEELFKLLNNCHRRTQFDTQNGVYFIRNGKAYTKKNGFVNNRADAAKFTVMKQTILDELRERFNFTGTKFYIPSVINYALPISAKQMTNGIPWGTKIACDGRITAGIQWNNVKEQQTDLDLHLKGINQSFGWNSSWKNSDCSIVYSGDMTDAKNGASEAFSILKRNDDYILEVYNYNDVKDATFKFFMCECEDRKLKRNPYNPNDVLFAPLDFAFDADSSTKTLGYFNKDSFVFFGGIRNDESRVPANNRENFIRGLQFIAENTISLAEVLAALGGEVVRELTVDAINLSPQNITEMTLFDLFYKV